MRPPNHAELNELNQATAHRVQPLAAFDSGKILDFHARPAEYKAMVKGMGNMLAIQSQRVFGTALVLMELDVPLNIEPLTQAIDVLEAYANTLAGYMQIDETGAVRV